MLRKDKAKLADHLFVGLKEIGESHSGGTPKEMIDKWSECLDLLKDFVCAWEEDLEYDAAAGILNLLTMLQGELYNVQHGKPSLIHKIDPETGQPLFPRLRGQQAGSLDEINLAICCAAVSVLLRSGFKLQAAASTVCRLMRKLKLPFPPIRNVAKARSDAAGDVDALLHWRKKILKQRVGDEPLQAYRNTIAQLGMSDGQSVEARVTGLLESWASQIGAGAN